MNIFVHEEHLHFDFLLSFVDPLQPQAQKSLR